MKRLIIVLVVLCGCTHVPDLKKGQCVVNETQIEGIDLSIPVPFVENVNILNLRFGFIQNKLYKGNNVPYYSDSNFAEISLIKGSGSVSRVLAIGYENMPNE